jgi:hypothetical protein
MRQLGLNYVNVILTSYVNHAVVDDEGLTGVRKRAQVGTRTLHVHSLRRKLLASTAYKSCVDRKWRCGSHDA